MHALLMRHCDGVSCHCRDWVREWGLLLLRCMCVLPMWPSVGHAAATAVALALRLLHAVLGHDLTSHEGDAEHVAPIMLLMLSLLAPVGFPQGSVNSSCSQPTLRDPLSRSRLAHAGRPVYNGAFLCR
jgi:fumarate reductase subunit D